MIETIAAALAVFALGFTLLSLRRTQGKVTALESDLDASQNHNRALIEQRDTLKTTLADTSAALETTKKRLEAVEAELAKLRREHVSLEHRVVDFQGQWSHQLSTLEEEISTLIRQLSEFRKGTTLPIPRPELTAASPAAAAAESSWSTPAPIGPRLAGTRPRSVSSEAPSPATDPAAARRLP